MKTSLIIDGNNLLHRVFWVANKFGSTPELLFLASIRKLVNEWSPTTTYVAWDSRLITDKQNYRKSLAPEYKGNRDQERNKEVYSFEKPIRKLLYALGVKCIHPGVLEADDIISYLCGHLEGQKVVISSDQDLLQLISSQTCVHNPMKKVTYNLQNFTDHFPVQLREFVDFKALMGDKSDNIPGLPKTGPKRAVTIIQSGIKETLTPSEYKQFISNRSLVDLSQGFINHPEEKSIYNYQVRKSANLEPNYDLFIESCKDIGIYDRLDYNYDVFFKTRDINNTVLSILS